MQGTELSIAEKEEGRPKNQMVSAVNDAVPMIVPIASSTALLMETKNQDGNMVFTISERKRTTQQLLKSWDLHESCSFSPNLTSITLEPSNTASRCCIRPCVVKSRSLLNLRRAQNTEWQ